MIRLEFAKDAPTQNTLVSTKERVSPLAIAVGLGLMAALVRLPFVRETPINWDSVQFVLALSRFDLHDHQPHPPGYILYVLAGRVLNALVGDPGLALSYLSVGASVLAVPLVYRLALLIFEDEAVALGSALLMMASPLALYYGSVGLTYMPEMALSLLVGWLAWTVRATPGEPGSALLLAGALGVAGGVRQSTLLLLLPLCAWALWGSNRRQWLLFAGALAFTCVLWLVPLLLMSGGIEPYLRENALLAERVSSRTSLVAAGPEGIAQNLGFEVVALGTGLAFALVPLGLWALRVVRFTVSPKLRAFLVWWTAPPLAFFAVSHLGQYGYVLVALPPLFMLAALCVRVLVETRAGERARQAAPLRAVTCCAALALASAGYFVFAQGPTTGPGIARNDEHWKAFSAVLASTDAGETVLVADTQWAGSFRAAGYLLPEFRTYGVGESRNEPLGWRYSAYGGRSDYALPWPSAQLSLKLPEGTRNVVVLDEELAQKFVPQESLRRVALSGGPSLYMLAARRDIEGLVVDGGTISAVYE
jgi:hypothetical protein